jgi:hypothetical protein
MGAQSNESELLAQELDHIGSKLEALESRVSVVEEVIPRLETAALTKPAP